jgi:hypothetical protein
MNFDTVVMKDSNNGFANGRVMVIGKDIDKIGDFSFCRVGFFSPAFFLRPFDEVSSGERRKLSGSRNSKKFFVDNLDIYSFANTNI